MDYEDSQVRLHAIKNYDVLERPTAPELQALVDLAALVCNVPNAAINLITPTHQHQIAASGFEPSVCARKDSLCAAVLDQPQTIVVADASKDRRFATNPFVTGEILDVRFYASAPLRTPAGLTIGRLCVFDSVPRSLSEEQENALDVLASRVADALELTLRSRQLEESMAQLTRTRDELRRSNERLSLFAGQVSHDLRNPLTAVMVGIEQLSLEPAIAADEYLSEIVKGAAAASGRMELMISAALKYARIGGQLHVTAVDLADVTGSVLADLKPAIDLSGATVEVEALPTVHADSNHLYVVLLNVLDNAIKFSRPGTPPRIRIACAARDDSRVRVEVRDNGRGVAPEKQEHMFTLFARADTGEPGSGIGLATARHIIESHDGRMGMESAPEQGTTVWFELPLGYSLS